MAQVRITELPTQDGADPDTDQTIVSRAGVSYQLPLGSFGADPGSGGLINLTPNGAGIQSHDGATQYELINFDAGQLAVYLGDATLSDVLVVSLSQQQFQVNGGTQLSISDGQINAQDCAIITTGYLALGSDPADTGGVRLTGDGTGGVYFENSPAGADIVGLEVDGGVLYVGGTNALTPPASLSVGAWFGTSGQFTAGDSGADYLVVSKTSLTYAIAAGAETIVTLSAGLANFDNNEIRTTGFLAVGATPASAGDIRGSTTLTYNVPTGGSHTFQVNNAAVLSVDATRLASSVVEYRFATAVVSPKIYQQDDATNSITGDTFLIQAQNATGTTSTGGLMRIRSGTGTTAPGSLELQIGTQIGYSVSSLAGAGSFHILGHVPSTGVVQVVVGYQRTDDGNSLLDFSASSGVADSLRIIRNGGVNGNSDITHKGTGGLLLTAQNAGFIRASVNGAVQLDITGTLIDCYDNEIRTTGPIAFGTGGGEATMRSGTGSPESAVTANDGSIFFRTDSTLGDPIYGKFSGTGNTGWLALAAAPTSLALTIASGTVAIPSTVYSSVVHIVLTGEGAAADTLNTVTGGRTGMVIYLSAAADGADITYAHAAGFGANTFANVGAANFTPTTTRGAIAYRHNGTHWTELHRAEIV